MTSFTATERRTVQSVTVKDNGMADIITLVEILNGEEVICRNSVRETVDAADAVEDIDRLLKPADWCLKDHPTSSLLA